MSFVITTKFSSFRKEWWIQTKKPKVEPQDVLTLWASGDELELIVQRIPNIPHAHTFTMWRG
jgi:hypothetical protein